MSKVTSKFLDGQFWADTVDRALASFAQGLLVVGSFDQSGVINVDWGGILSMAGGYALASVATSVAFRGGANKNGGGAAGDQEQ